MQEVSQKSLLQDATEQFKNTLLRKYTPIAREDVTDPVLYGRYLRAFFKMQTLFCQASKFIDLSDMEVMHPRLAKNQPIVAEGNDILLVMTGYHQLLTFNFEEDPLLEFENAVKNFVELITKWEQALHTSPEHSAKATNPELCLAVALLAADRLSEQFGFFRNCLLSLNKVPKVSKHRDSGGPLLVASIARDCQAALGKMLEFAKSHSSACSAGQKQMAQYLNKQTEELQEVFQSILRVYSRSLIGETFDIQKLAK